MSHNYFISTSAIMTNHYFTTTLPIMAKSTTFQLVSPKASSSTSENSPYYLHPPDNPCALINSVLLQGYNYFEWAKEFSNSEISRLLATKSMIVGWICTSIGPNVRSTVTLKVSLLISSLKHYCNHSLKTFCPS